jgi:hypothetical protein
VTELTPHDVRVIATRTVPQGIGALLAFNFEADLETNVGAMDHAAGAVHTIEVTRAVRDADVDQVSVRAGQMMGIYDGDVVVATESADDAVVRSLDHAQVDALEIVTIYYGADATDADAHTLAGRLREAHPGLNVEVMAGGQPHYPFMVSLE